MSTTETSRPAISEATSATPSLGGTPTTAADQTSPDTHHRGIGCGPTLQPGHRTSDPPTDLAWLDHDTQQSTAAATTKVVSTAGAHSTASHATPDDHLVRAGRGPHSRPTTRRASPIGDSSGGANSDPAASRCAPPMTAPLLDPTLSLAADVLDDLEKVRIANANRLGTLTRSTEDKDGEVRGFGLPESHPDVKRLASMVQALEGLEREATKNLERVMRRHPLHGWAKAQRGVGDKQLARLLAAVGDPYIRPDIVREDADGNETVEPSRPRTVSELWAYCGLQVVHDYPAGQTTNDAHAIAAGRVPYSPNGHGSFVAQAGDAVGGTPVPTGDQRFREVQHGLVPGRAPKRAKGQRANWSTTAKTRTYLIAKSCIKQWDKTNCPMDEQGNVAHSDTCTCSPFRVVYDQRKTHTRSTHPEWTDGHRDNDATRVMGKEILKHLWRAARDHHNPEAEELT